MTNTPIEHRHQQQQHHQYQDQYQQLQRPGRMKLTHAQARLYPGKGLIQGQDVSPTSPPLQPLPRPLRIETEEDKIVEEEEGRGSSPVSVTSSVSSFPNKPKDGSKYKPRSGILRRFGKKIKHAFQKKPSSSLSPSSSSSSSETNKVKSETGGVRIFSSASEAVRAGVPGSTIPVHTYNGNNYNYNGAYANAGAEGESSSDSYDGGDKEELKEEVRRTTAKIRAKGGDGSRSSINTRVKSHTWYAGQPPPIAIPIRSSSLHAYSTNDGGSGSGSPIELIPWHGSPPQESSIENFPAFDTASAGTTSTAAAVLRAPTPTPMMGLPISRTKTRTRTTTITTTRTSPVITIKLVHTPSDQSSASSTTGSSDESVCAPATHYHSRDQAILCEQEQEEGDDDSDECIEDLQAALELLRDRTESDSSDPFLTFDSTSPRYQDKQDDPNDRLSDIEEEDQETDRTDETGEKDFDSDESSTDGNKNGDNWPGSGFDNVPEASQGYFDDESYTSTSPPTRVSASDQGAAGADSPTSEIIHSSTTTTPSAAALTTSTTQKNPPTTTTQGDAERESLNWIDHFLSLNGAYRDHLSTLHLQLAKALHDNLIQHTRGMIHLQHQILGVRGIGNGQLVSMFLEDLVMKKLQPRMQRDLREQRQFCLALGELMQQAFGRSMLTVDYEEDAYEGVRVDQVPRRWKGKKKKWSEDGSDEDEAMVSELEQEQEQGEEEEEEEEREVAKLAKRVDEASRASLPIDHEWSLFRWTFLQRPYATLMDLNQARTHSEHQHHQFQQQYQQQDSQQEQVDDTAGQNANDCLMEEDAAALSEEGQNEQKVDEDDNVWSLAGESSWLHGQTDRSSHHDHDLDSNNGDLDDHGYDGENGEYKLPLDTPGRSPAPFRSRRNHYPSSSRGSSSDDSAPAAGGNNITATPFYRHDPSNCRLESMNVPAFSEPGTPAGATTQTGTRAGDGAGAESGAAAVSSSTAAAGLNSNPEWIRVIRALTETDAASAAPGTRLPIWVVYAPSIPASSAAAAGTRPTTTAIPAATTAPAASATTPLPRRDPLPLQRVLNIHVEQPQSSNSVPVVLLV
ncbi:hypothetical protein BGX29_001560 [Mortierella sp. GBA35]|nr:hypothetical protein BGX29_001560 [Mortierella sp. GBA35]